MVTTANTIVIVLRVTNNTHESVISIQMEEGIVEMIREENSSPIKILNNTQKICLLSRGTVDTTVVIQIQVKTNHGRKE